MKNENGIKRAISLINRLLLMASSLTAVVAIMLAFYAFDPSLSFVSSITNEPQTSSQISYEFQNGIHLETGFIEADGVELVIANCTGCHSSKLVIQNRMNPEQWKSTIKWMQETQNLWDLGSSESSIIEYLVTNYPAPKERRRASLSDIEWYELED